MYIRHLNEGVILLNVLKLNKLCLNLYTNVVVDVVSGIILLLFYAAHIFNKLACQKVKHLSTYVMFTRQYLLSI